jgi:hypothetical protein
LVSPPTTPTKIVRQPVFKNNLSLIGTGLRKELKVIIAGYDIKYKKRSEKHVPFRNKEKIILRVLN